MANLDINEMVALQRKRNALLAKLELLQAYNHNTRFGQLWINGDFVELTRSDFECVKAHLISKTEREIEAINDEVARAVRF